MPDERRERAGITAAIESTDWTRYAGPAAAVRRRGERRRHRLQATAALGTTFAAVGVAVGMNVAGHGPGESAAQQGAKPTSSATEMSNQPTGPAGYPSFPAKPVTKPILVSNPGHVLRSGVIGAGAVSGHHWQISYRVTPSGSAADSQPVVTQFDVSIDGKAISLAAEEGDRLTGGGGYLALDQYFRNSGVPSPIVVANGSPSPGVTAVDLRWKNGTVVQVPIQTVDGARFAPFAWDPRNPPEAVEQVSGNGVEKITITDDGDAMWQQGPLKAPFPVTSMPAVSTPTGTPNLSQTPHAHHLDAGILGEGTVAGHSWQFAYEIIPSGSAANASNEVFCTDTTVDGTTRQGGCTSSKPFVTQGLSFSYRGGHSQFPIVVDYGTPAPGTTSVGLEWDDGTKTATAVHMVEGSPMVALAFDPAKAPSYLVEFGSYGEYRVPLTAREWHVWTFNWPN